jgi:hypothetical protein
VSVGAWNPSELSTTWLEALHRRRMALLWALVMLVSLVMVRLILAVDVFAVAGLFVWICVGATVVRPRYGLYAVFGIVLLFEGSSDDPLMAPGVYLNNSLQNTLGASGGILIPLEILMLLILVAWLGQGLMRHQTFDETRCGLDTEVFRQYGPLVVGLHQEYPPIWKVLGDRHGQPNTQAGSALADNCAAHRHDFRSEAHASSRVDASKDLVCTR